MKFSMQYVSFLFGILVTSIFSKLGSKILLTDTGEKKYLIFTSGDELENHVVDYASER